MPLRRDLLNALADFKSARDAMIHADDDELAHHLRLFVKQLDSNPLCKPIIDAVPPFNVDGWWAAQSGIAKLGRRQLEALDLPESKSEQLAIYMDFAKSFVSGDPKQATPEGFGRAFGKHKRSDAIGIAKSFILRPLADELTRRIRDAATMTNPAIRELAGVPLDRIPSEGELGIFLSHKSIDKERVRRYYRPLKELGFEPWLDEHDIVAGDVLHRALGSGMDTSCAAVFFVTSAFKDEHWLGREVDLAVHRQVERGNKFQIITLVFDGAQVPKPLQTYVFAQVSDDLEGFREVIRSLPIELGPARWKQRVTKGGA